MELSSNGIDWLLLSGRLCVAMLFAVSAASKLRQEPAEIKVLTNLHVSAPAAAEMITGVCAAIGVVALVLGFYVRGASYYSPSSCGPFRLWSCRSGPVAILRRSVRRRETRSSRTSPSWAVASTLRPWDLGASRSVHSAAAPTGRRR